MKRQKIKENRPEGQTKTTDKSWKRKAKEKSAEIKLLRKRNSELKTSRDLWKSKYQISQKQAKKGVTEEGTKARYHQYSLLVVMWIMHLQNYGKMSLRSCRHSVSSLYLVMGLSGRVPSHESIRNWLCKHGYYRVQQAQKCAQKRIIYVDESIVLGGEKILLVLGIVHENIPSHRCVNHEDVEVLYVGSAKEWKGEAIAEILKEINGKTEIPYVVGDQGTNLKKAYSICKYAHIEDCTHILSNYLKHIYQNDSTFEGFRKLIGVIRKAWFLSKDKSQFMPPSMRGKLRFANIFPCVDWAKKQLENWGNLEESVTKKLAFLKENQAFIEELVVVTKIFKSVCEILKNKGFGTAQKALILKELPTESTFKNVLIFSQNIRDYLDKLSEKSAQIGGDFLLCSSDIIESFFGKFKQKICPNSPHKLTEFIFTIANFSKKFSIKEVQNALEFIKIKDLKELKNLKKVAPI